MTARRACRAAARRPARCCVAAREAAGLSIDAVAQQLKLAPRQVRGARGRRLQRICPAARSSAASSATTRGSCGSIPTRCWARCRREPRRRRSMRRRCSRPRRRWASCRRRSTRRRAGRAGRYRSTLAAVVAAAAVYEWVRPAGAAHPAAPTATAPETSAAAPAAPDKAGTPLPNPVAAGTPAAEPRRPARACPGDRARPDDADVAIAGASAPTATPAARPPQPRQAKRHRAHVPRLFVDRDPRPRRTRHPVRHESRRHDAERVGHAAARRRDRQRRRTSASPIRGNPIDLVPHTRQNVARFRLP